MNSLGEQAPQSCCDLAMGGTVDTVFIQLCCPIKCTEKII